MRKLHSASKKHCRLSNLQSPISIESRSSSASPNDIKLLLSIHPAKSLLEEEEDEVAEKKLEKQKRIESMELPSSWDSLRKQARILEGQLDEQMNSYRRMVSTKVDGSENDIESGIERLLKQLQQVISQMQAWISSGRSEIVSHTFTRYQDILQDLTQEFYRLRSSLRAKQEHASLLEDFREYDQTRLDLEEGGSSMEQTLLKEHASISRSSGQMDNVISQAQATLGALAFQRATFGGISSKLSNVSSRLPMVNQIISSIKRKKSMDSVVLSLVASVCTFLILIYWLTK